MQPLSERKSFRCRRQTGRRQRWRAAAGVYGALIRFLLLTATRRNEAARMRWEETPTRAAAFKAVLDLTMECLAREAEYGWLHGETVSIRVEADPDAP
jgi:integrase